MNNDDVESDRDAVTDLINTDRHNDVHIVKAVATARKYHALFPDISSISSRELIRETFSPLSSTSSILSTTRPQPNWKIRGRHVLLVDVRTKPEREVSMISGAISMHEFRESILPSLLYLKKNTEDENFDSNQTSTLPADESHLETIILMYCTVGFRSGIEVRKLQHEYPSLFQSCDREDTEKKAKNENSIFAKAERAKIRIGHLDGIVNFANAAVDLSSSKVSNDMKIIKVDKPFKISPALQATQMSSSPEATATAESTTNKITHKLENSSIISQTLLIDPITQRPTRRVHVFGPPWKKCLSAESHDVVVFFKVELFRRSLATFARSICLCCHTCVK